MILGVKFDKTIVDFSCNTKLVLTCIKLNKHLNTYMFGMIKANITMYIYINKIDLHFTIFYSFFFFSAAVISGQIFSYTSQIHQSYHPMYTGTIVTKCHKL